MFPVVLLAFEPLIALLNSFFEESRVEKDLCKRSKWFHHTDIVSVHAGPEAYSISGMACAVKSLLTSQCLGDVHLVGYSLGARVALEVCAQGQSPASDHFSPPAAFMERVVGPTLLINA